MRDYDSVLVEMSEQIERALNGKRRYVIYSAYETDDELNIPINNLNDVAVEGKVIFAQSGDDFFGNGKSYTSKVYENPTWLDVAVVANEAIEATGDDHHVFLEGVHRSRAIRYINDICVYFLTMGS